MEQVILLVIKLVHYSMKEHSMRILLHAKTIIHVYVHICINGKDKFFLSQ